MAPTINPSSLDRFRDKPALLHRMIQIYLDTVPKMIADMQESAINQDTEKVSFLAHSIRVHRLKLVQRTSVKLASNFKWWQKTAIRT